MYMHRNFRNQKIASPETLFYDYLDNEHISDPTKFNGKVKKVVRTFKEYDQSANTTTIEKINLFVNRNNVLEKTVRRTYSFGIEDYKEVTNHLEEPKAEIVKKGNQTIKKIIKNEPENNFYGYPKEHTVYNTENK